MYLVFNFNKTDTENIFKKFSTMGQKIFMVWKCSRELWWTGIRFEEKAVVLDMQMCMWAPGDTRNQCHLFFSFILHLIFLRKGLLLIQLEGWEPLSSRIVLSSCFQPWGYRNGTHHYTQLFIWVLKIQTQVLVSVQQALHQLSHVTGPHKLFFNNHRVSH